MTEIKISDKETGLSVIQDPFKKTMVTHIHVHAIKGFLGGKWTFSGSVKFENGNTKGEQEFKGENFDDVVLKIKAMIDNLE